MSELNIPTIKRYRMESLYIEYDSDEYEQLFDIDKVDAITTLATTLIKSKMGELSISFVSSKRMKSLNKEFRNKEESTDILSFVNEDDGFFSIEEEPILGDIVISLEDMLQNCEYFGAQKDNELIRLIVHGLLHLNGHDHASNEISEPMLQLQEEIVKNIEKELGQ